MSVSVKIDERNRRWFPGFVPAHEVYLALALERAPAGARVLHLGAGRDALEVGARLPGRSLVAVDCDEWGLALNPASEKVLASGESLPFPDSTVDLILCEHVFEHLEAPKAVLAECFRVLKPGGAMLFLTPNRWSYVAVAAALTPYRFHVWYKSLMIGTAQVDTFATFYRINTRRAIEAIADDTGLRLREFRTFVGWPTYLERGEWLHRAGALLHWALERLPSSLHISLVGVLEKPSLKLQ
jgi:SAM-dependent methyltransferase